VGAPTSRDKKFLVRGVNRADLESRLISLVKPG